MSSQRDGAIDAYRRGCEHDRSGREAEAIPEYERALELGIEGSDRRGALLGLGSSLRNVKRNEDAVVILRRAVSEFPGDANLRCFLALALHSAGRNTESVATLLDLALEHAPVDDYRRALTHYAGELRPKH